MFQRKKLSLSALPEISVPTKVEEASCKSLGPQSRSDVLYGLTRPEIYSLCKIKGKIKTTKWKICNESQALNKYTEGSQEYMNSFLQRKL